MAAKAVPVKMIMIAADKALLPVIMGHLSIVVGVSRLSRRLGTVNPAAGGLSFHGKKNAGREKNHGCRAFSMKEWE